MFICFIEAIWRECFSSLIFRLPNVWPKDSELIRKATLMPHDLKNTFYHSSNIICVQVVPRGTVETSVWTGVNIC